VDSRWSLGSAFKVKLRLHYSWIAVVVFMTAAIMTEFSTDYNILQRLILGLLACLLFIIIIILRAFIINIFAVGKGVVVRSSTIFAVASVMDIDETKNYNPAVEVLLAIVGLLANLIIAVILYLAYEVLANTENTMVYVLLQWLAFIFFMLILFDVFPVLPLDGGRILGAFLWKATKKYDLITNILSWAGWITGFGLIVAGIFLIVSTKQWFVGVLLVLPGLILQNSATLERRLVKKQNGDQKQTENSSVSTSAG